MSVQTQIDRISGAVSAALAALTEKGVTVPDGTKVDGLAALIAAIEAGGGGGGDFLYGTITPTETTRYIDAPADFERNMAAFVEVGMDIASVGAKCGVSDHNKNLENRFMYYGTQLTYTTADSSTVFNSAGGTRFRSPSSNNNSYFQAGKTYMYVLFKA